MAFILLLPSPPLLATGSFEPCEGLSTCRCHKQRQNLRRSLVKNITNMRITFPPTYLTVEEHHPLCNLSSIRYNPSFGDSGVLFAATRIDKIEIFFVSKQKLFSIFQQELIKQHYMACKLIVFLDWYNNCQC